jgi:predicted F0F1-ATPase subunit
MVEGRARRDGARRPDAGRALERDVARLRRREPEGQSFWRSLSVLGTVGWSISVPAAAGAWLGHRLDLRLGSGVRFTLMLLVGGVIFGSVVAWRVLREHRE